MTHKNIVYSWMDANYDGNNLTIRSIWYDMKSYIQKCNAAEHKTLTDKSTTKLIGKYLWDKFVDGEHGIYGNITNSPKVKVGNLPIVLVCEKNTLLPFQNLSKHITSFEYNSSGQVNSFEIANIILPLMEHHDEIFIFGVTDFDKAGTHIYNTVVNKFSKVFTVIDQRFATELDGYDTFMQPNGTLGVELDAIPELQSLVYAQLEEFLPPELFEQLAIEYKQSEIYFEELKADEVYQDLVAEIEKHKKIVWDKVQKYEYEYLHTTENLNNLATRVKKN